MRVAPGSVSPTAAKYFGDAEKELKPARERRVHLVGYRLRWKEKQAPVGEEGQREQHLEHPEQDIHERSRCIKRTRTDLDL
jgi:hypothetical protein